jgi:hypothetical protein
MWKTIYDHLIIRQPSVYPALVKTLPLSNPLKSLYITSIQNPLGSSVLGIEENTLGFQEFLATKLAYLLRVQDSDFHID